MITKLHAKLMPMLKTDLLRSTNLKLDEQRQKEEEYILSFPQ